MTTTTHQRSDHRPTTAGRLIRRWVVITLVVVLALATAAAYYVGLFFTSMAACGVFGCAAGPKVVFSPDETQVAMVVTGLVLLPLTLVVLRRCPRRYQVAGAAAVVVAGAAVAMGLLGLGPDGCPSGQARATVGPSAYNPGALTCSGDQHAVPAGT